MAASEFSQVSLKRAARRAYERGRVAGALWRGAAAAAVAVPGVLACNQTLWAGLCLAGFGLVVTAARIRGESFEEGARSGALAGILPCLLPSAVRAFDPDFCVLASAYGAGLCAIAGVAAGVTLGLRRRPSAGLPFWAGALLALALAAAIGCIPAGAMGFAGLAIGVVAGGLPVFASRKAFV
jgi:hypothetical protein